MNDEDAINYANKLINTMKKLPDNYTYQVPVKKIRSVCNLLINYSSAKRDLPKLTDVENTVLNAIKDDINNGMQPTIRSVSKKIGYKTHSSAQDVINRLIRHGYIKRSGSRKQIVLDANVI